MLCRILQRRSPDHLRGRFAGQSLGGAASVLGFSINRKALNSAERAILAWLRSRETQVVEVGGRTRDSWRAITRSGKVCVSLAATLINQLMDVAVDGVQK